MRLSIRMLVVAVVAAGLVVAPGATATRSGSHDKSSPASVPPPIGAQEFLAKAAAGNLFEIVTGRLAQERASSRAVKALGAQFVTDHTALLEQGRAVAAQLGIAVPEALAPEQQRIVDRLQRLSGKRFDHKWLAAQIVAHQQALELHLRGAIRGDVAEIRTLAQGGLPIVTHHYGQLLDLVTDDHSRHGDRHDGDGGHRG
jgi:putative membrane protein